MTDNVKLGVGVALGTIAGPYVAGAMKVYDQDGIGTFEVVLAVTTFVAILAVYAVL